MRKVFISCLFIFTGFFCFPQSEMPEKMKQALLQLRPGIFDLEDKTVEQIFLNKIFISKEQLDGSISTAKYGNFILDGNEFFLNIDFYNGQIKNATITYVLLFQGNSTLLDRIIVNNYQTGEKAESSEFSDKYQMLLVFFNLIDKNSIE